MGCFHRMLIITSQERTRVFFFPWFQCLYPSTVQMTASLMVTDPPTLEYQDYLLPWKHLQPLASCQYHSVCQLRPLLSQPAQKITYESEWLHTISSREESMYISNSLTSSIWWMEPCASAILFSKSFSFFFWYSEFSISLPFSSNCWYKAVVKEKGMN